MNFLKGKKTIIAMCLFAVLAVVSLIPNITIPEGAFAILGALGLGFLRAGVTKLSGNAGWKTFPLARCRRLVHLTERHRRQTCSQDALHR